jgi:GNAT superfamily N-acetyltransferase
MGLKFEYLADRVEAIPIISKWYYDEWGHLPPENGSDGEPERLEDYLNYDVIPFILVATNGDEVMGAGALKFHEMAEMFPEKEHWLGGVYIAANQRGKGYASLLVEKIANLAPTYGVRTLHLQTQSLDGGLYARLGWKPYAQVNSRGVNVLVMERRL